MILGTHSNAGKSVIAAGLCRLLSRRGYDVAPFKAQNMSNNAGVTRQGGEMGRAQIVQAEAAGIEPHTDMNPVLLKPEADLRSQIVLNGEVHGAIDSSNWMDLKQELWQAVRESYDRLSTRHDVIVLEGAGSPAEINLKAMDMVNLAMARHAGAPCLLVGDIDRGGVFAALAGTMLLLDPEERAQIKGLLINKFRGDVSLLGDGIKRLEELTYGARCLGIVPFLPYLEIAAEDAVDLDRMHDNAGQILCDVAVIQLPHISNFDEFDHLERERGVRLRYVRDRDPLGEPDAIIVPGSKSTFADLKWLEERGLGAAITLAHGRGIEVVGICGGYQMLGRSLHDPEGAEGSRGQRMDGLALLPTETNFARQKRTHLSALRLRTGATVSGYEIHTGKTQIVEASASPLGTIVERDGNATESEDGAVTADLGVWGTYLHGLFANTSFRREWLRRLGWQMIPQAPGVEVTAESQRLAEFDRVADALEQAVGWPSFARIIGLS